MAGGDQNGGAAAGVVMVMVPFVAHGHINQLLHLSRLISAHNIPIHFVCTTTQLRQAQSRFHGFHPLSAAAPIHFLEVPTPPFNSPPPNPAVAFPSHLQPSFDSTLHLRRPVADLILSLSRTARRVAVVHDSLMSYVVQDAKSIPNAETYNFRPLSAFYHFWSKWEKAGRPFPVDPDLLNRIPSRDGTVTPEFKEFTKLQYAHMNTHVGEIFDASRVVEGKFLEYLDREEISEKTKVWAMGPFNPIEVESDSKTRHKCLQWLDKQAANSVIYVSFGTTTTFTTEQITEIAIGLEKSKQMFVWVLRVADKGHSFGDSENTVELPIGFEARVEGRGLVVRGWAPQMEILGHFATGGFMSHCGWNSSMESISMEVPMATWPMHSDQPMNAVLIADVLGIGVVVKDWARRDELVMATVVEKAVRKLMDSREGEEMRKRVAELGDAVKKSMADGGVSREEMDSFVSYVKR